MSDKTKLQIVLEDKFEQLADARRENNDVPEELKEEVFETLDKVDEVEDLAELLNGEVGDLTPAFLDSIEKPAKHPATENEAASDEEAGVSS
jgi:hypothetical protein